jgi:hypothetical protein
MDGPTEYAPPGQSRPARSGRDPERGAALVVSLITLVGLLAIGAVTLMSVQSEITSAGASRFEQTAMYGAESGVSAGLEYLRTSCETNGAFFSNLVEPNNVNPVMPVEIAGNDKKPGEAGNLFTIDTDIWYQVQILNNITDSGYAAGNDSDAIVVLRARGYGPNNTQAVIEVEVRNDTCIATYCSGDYAQENISAQNNATTVCAVAIDLAGGTRVLTPGGP